MGDFVNHFAGTARFYAACRPEYPDAVWDLLVREARLDSSSNVLDLGCGPGTAALALAGRVGAVTAVDADEGMLEEGRRAARVRGLANVRWVRALAEEFTDEGGKYRLVVIASAFHWMDRAAVAANSHTLLAPGGVLALLGSASVRHAADFAADLGLSVHVLEAAGDRTLPSPVEIVLARR